jgi:hypothetical protein
MSWSCVKPSNSRSETWCTTLGTWTRSLHGFRMIRTTLDPAASEGAMSRPKAWILLLLIANFALSPGSRLPRSGPKSFDRGVEPASGPSSSWNPASWGKRGPRSWGLWLTGASPRTTALACSRARPKYGECTMTTRGPSRTTWPAWWDPGDRRPYPGRIPRSWTSNKPLVRMGDLSEMRITSRWIKGADWVA